MSIRTDQQTFCKHSLKFEELSEIPAVWFVEELDLSADDKREISNPGKEGWQIALLDSLLPEQRNYLDETLRKILRPMNLGHFNQLQKPWITRSGELYALSKSVEPSSMEAIEAYSLGDNSKRYRIAYLLGYPEMHEILLDRIPSLEKERYSTLETFLEKADEIAKENFYRHSVNGLIDANREDWARAKRNSREWIILDCYKTLIVDPLKAIMNEAKK